MRMQLIPFLTFAISLGANAAALPSGSFTKPCSSFEEDDFLISKLKLESGTWERVRTAYEEDSCATAWIEYREEARIKRWEETSLDLEFVRASYLPLTAEVAEALNISAFCGRADWKAGIATPVTGQACDDFRVPKLGAPVYASFRREGENGLRISVWGANLTDRYYYVQLLGVAGANDIGAPAAPRTYGMTVGYRF
ncbi:MAG: TonB-dependent receptor [Proteobacteria bacterium]|nr:MAG: TonB-dependent receptor [Pseudomonadota bacterium]